VKYEGPRGLLVLLLEHNSVSVVRVRVHFHIEVMRMPCEEGATTARWLPLCFCNEQRPARGACAGRSVSFGYSRGQHYLVGTQKRSFDGCNGAIVTYGGSHGRPCEHRQRCLC